jgi:hypothetical protein
MKRGSYVSRSVFAKLQGERNRLMKDIEVMACGEPMEAIQMRLKWRKKFEQDKKFWDTVKIAAAQYAKEHPEILEGIKRKK